MSDDVVGHCLTPCLTALTAVCLGICYDFMSIRHSCTEHLCTCRRTSVEIDPRERESLIRHTQPSPQAPMPKPPEREHE